MKKSHSVSSHYQLDWREINDRVESFVEQFLRGQKPKIESFLPPNNHPLYMVILCELLRVDLEQHWKHESTSPLLDYQQCYPALFADPDLVEQLTYEEYRLRCQSGELVHPEEYELRFQICTDAWPVMQELIDESDQAPLNIGKRPSFPTFPEFESDPTRIIRVDEAEEHEPIEVINQEHPAIPDELQTTSLPFLPRVGTHFLGFHLIAELGRGSFGRVFLAYQGDLANRPVVLKVTHDPLGEAQTLAQFQHTNIVPIYSVHRVGTHHAVCMPYFGPTTLADVLRALQEQNRVPTSGRLFGDVVRKNAKRFPRMRNSVSAARSDC